MTYREEFPDFDPATMPAIPAEWEDISWHNDVCPCFDAGRGRLVYVDYAEQSKREWEGRSRFIVMVDPRDNTEIRTVLETNEWQEVLDLFNGF